MHIAQLKLSGTAGNIAVRLIVLYALYIVTFFSISSVQLGHFLNRPYIGPQGFNTFPLLLIALLLGFFFFAYRSALSSAPSVRISTRQLICSLIVLLAVILFAFWATHPMPGRYEAMHAYIRSHPVTGGPLLAATLFTALFLPFPAMLLLFLPTSFLHTFRKPFIFGILLFITYLYANVLEAYFHLAVSPTVFSAVDQLLVFFQNNASVVPDHLRLQLDEFAVIVGPVCTGFTMFTLFVGLFVYMWNEYHFEKLRAILALIIGLILLFLLNIVRIAAILLVGARYPGMGVALFHGTIGSLLFFMVFMGYLFWVAPYLKKHK